MKKRKLKESKIFLYFQIKKIEEFKNKENRKTKWKSTKKEWKREKTTIVINGKDRKKQEQRRKCNENF